MRFLEFGLCGGEEKACFFFFLRERTQQPHKWKSGWRFKYEVDINWALI